MGIFFAVHKESLEGYRRTKYLVDVGENCGRGVPGGRVSCIHFYSLVFELRKHLPFPVSLLTGQQGPIRSGSEDTELCRTQMCVFSVKEAGV